MKMHPMDITKKEAIKKLWVTIDSFLNLLKITDDNSILPDSTYRLWDDVEKVQKTLRAINGLNAGVIYKWTHYREDVLLFRVESFRIKNEGLVVVTRAITSTKKQFNYKEVKDIQEYPVSEMGSSDIEEYDLDPKDLPLYINNDFIGSLFKEMLDKAGIPTPTKATDPLGLDEKEET